MYAASAVVDPPLIGYPHKKINTQTIKKGTRTYSIERMSFEIHEQIKQIFDKSLTQKRLHWQELIQWQQIFLYHELQ